MRVRVFDAPWSTLRTADDTLVVVDPAFDCPILRSGIAQLPKGDGR